MFTRTGLLIFVLFNTILMTVIMVSFTAELSILFSDLANLTSILDAVENTEHVKTIVTLEKVSDESIIARANKMGLKLLDFDELLVRFHFIIAYKVYRFIILLGLKIPSLATF